MKKKFRVIIDGEVYEVEVEIEEGLSPVQTLATALQTGRISRVQPKRPEKGTVTAPITGKLVELKVSPGDPVEKNDVIAILEAMKTQIEVKAGVKGVVEKVYVNQGDPVKQGDPIVRIREAE